MVAECGVGVNVGECRDVCLFVCLFNRSVRADTRMSPVLFVCLFVYAVAFAHYFLGVKMFRPSIKKRVHPMVPDRGRRALHILLFLCALPGE